MLDTPVSLLPLTNPFRYEDVLPMPDPTPVRKPGADRRHVLLIGDDPDLLRTRQMLLGIGGYELLSISSKQIAEIDLNSFHLAVICHTLTINAETLGAAIHESAHLLPLLFLVRPGMGCYAALWPCSSPAPRMLLDAVEQMVSVRSALQAAN